MNAVAPLRLRAATAEDLPRIRALLEADALPTADLAQPGGGVEFLVGEDDAGLAGAIGLERHGAAGLLRSLVVAPDRRVRGAGTALVAALEALARDRGLAQLVLLTTTAREFFARRGYAVVDRSTVDPALQASSEFRHLCPATATCMRRNLAAPGAG